MHLKEIAAVFLRLGLTAFGGPAAHIAMMQEELVRRRAWLTQEEFLDLVGAAGLIPGPTSTEVAIFAGHRRGGWAGLVTAGTCFIAPAAVLVTAIAWGYVRYGRLPAMSGAMTGVKPVIVAVLVQALVAFARSAVKTRGLAVVGVGAAVASALGGMPILVLLGAGLVSVIARSARREGAPLIAVLAPTATATATTATAASAAATSAAAPGLAAIFAAFLKVGALVFGSGYVLLAFLREDLVTRTRWLTETQLVDAIAVGQLTPGPVFTTATFIGYVLAGLPGAVVATVAIFLPSFALVAASGPLLPRVRRSRAASAFLDGVNVASFALMVVVTAQLARAAVVDVTTALVAAVSALALLRWRVNSAWLVVAGGALGALLAAR
jgi:chromate transporter